MMRFFKQHISAMEAYRPGEQPARGRAVIKLNTNENPYPPSARVAEALATLGDEAMRVYPDPAAGELRECIGQLCGVPAEWVLPGNGSDNLIVMIARACGGPIAIASPTFPYYATQAAVENARLIEVPCLGEAFDVDIDGLIAAGATVTFLANPNSPTGTMLDGEALDRLAAGLAGLLVIDEAYIDFAPADALATLGRYENVIVLRTLSKGYSLAGLRFGYALARPEILKGLWKTKEIYNVSAATQAAALAALQDQAWKVRNAARVLASRAELAEQLAARGWRVWPSEANFLLTRPGEKSAGAVADALAAANILVRLFDTPTLPPALRITVGTDEQNRALLDAIDRIGPARKDSP
jgi:histidinol-phosphate aminotransferase